MAHEVRQVEPVSGGPAGGDGPILDLEHEHKGHDDDDLKADGAPDHGAMAHYVDDDHEPATDKPKKKKPKKAAAKKAKQVAKAIAHKTQAPKALDPATQALVDKALAASNKLLADTQKIVKESDERQAKDNLRKSINDSKAVAYGVELAMYSRNMGSSTSKAFLQRLDSIDDADLRDKVREQFKQQTGQTLEQFIKSNDEWNNDGANRDQHAALQLIDKKRDSVNDAIRAMDPNTRALKEKEANDAAIEILAGTTAHDHSDKNQQRIFRALQGRDPVEVEMIRAAIRTHTNGESNLYQAIDNGMHKGNEDAAVAMLAGDRLASARAVFKNERDPDRLREVLKQLKPEERMQLAPMGPHMVAGVKNPADRAELVALMFNNTAAADAERLGNLLKPPAEGMSVKMGDMRGIELGAENAEHHESGNVLKEFESMSAAEVKAAAAAWDKQHPDRPFRQMIEARWTGDSNSDEKARLLAMVDGDKGKARSIRLQEAMRTGNQKEIEAALAHDKVSQEELNSADPAARARAEARQAENASFERNNQLASESRQRVDIFLGSGGDLNAIEGKGTQDQITAHYQKQSEKDIAPTDDEKRLRAWGMIEAADELRAKQHAEHQRKTGHNEIAANELVADGKLSKGTELHRATSTKERTELLEGIKSNADLEKAKADFAKYDGEKLLPYIDKPRAEMNANELQIDNIRLYGVRSERPAQVEYILQVQQYKKQYSSALENDEADEAGGGSQTWQRQELEAQRKLLKDPKVRVGDPKRLGDGQLGQMSFLVENPDDPSFADLEKMLPYQGSIGADGKKVDDGLKDGVTKAQYNMLDKGMTEASKTQAEAKKRLADRITSMISTIAKLAALLTLNPALIALINLGEGLINMGVRAQVMGEAYDPALDAKMVALTLAADVAMLGFSKAGGAAKQAVLGQASNAAKRKVIESAEHAVVHHVVDQGADTAIRALKAEARYMVAGQVVQHTVSTVGGGIIQGQSPSDILKSYAAGGVAMFLPNALSERMKKAIGNDSLAQKVLAEIAETGVDVGTNAALSIAGGQDASDAGWDAVLGHASSRYHNHVAPRLTGSAPDDAAPAHHDTHADPLDPATHLDPSHAPDEHAIKQAAEQATDPSHASNENASATSKPPVALDENYQPINIASDSAAVAKITQDQQTAKPPAHLDETISPIKRSDDPDNLQRTGASTAPTPIGGGPSDTHHRTVEHSADLSDRAVQRRAAMDPETRKLHDQQFALAENPGQQAILERAMASGREPHELVALRKAMEGLSDTEVLKRFSGAGMFQFYHQSCVPTAYQIALADLDPVYALHLRENPGEMMQVQRDVLIAGGAAQTPRQEKHNKGAHMQGQLANEGTQALLKEERYSSDGAMGGIDVTSMADKKLHKQLEAATGTTYEIMTPVGGSDSIDVPIDRIKEATAANKPVLFSMQGHEYAMVGQHVGPDGQVSFKYHDPMSGTTALMPAEVFMAFGIQTLTLPGSGERSLAGTSQRTGAISDSDLPASADRILRELEQDAPRREEKRSELDGTIGHPGIEVHSHLMGVVEPDVFRHRAAVATGGDPSSWQSVFAQLAELPKLEADRNAQTSGKKGSVFRHRLDGDGRIVERAKAGDAGEIIRSTKEQVERLRERMLEADEADRPRYLRAMELLAEDATRASLTASPETAFDSAYVMRDALIRTTFGSADDRANGNVQASFDDVLRETVLQLARDGIGYSEQSTGLGKLSKETSPDRIRDVIRALEAEGKIEPGEVEIQMLAMMKTSNLGGPDDRLPSSSAKQSKDSEHAKESKAAFELAKKQGVIGPDYGGPEHNLFNEVGKQRFDRDYDAALAVSTLKGIPVVLRPHVGEGVADTKDGLPFHTDKNRHAIADEPSHYLRARENIEALLVSLEQRYAEQRLDPSKVIVRFGHATHATPDQVSRMKAIGIIAEVNLGSNVATGSLSQTDGVNGQRASSERLGDHALTSMLFYGADVLLSTDGGSVMNTSLRGEYARAYSMIEAVLSGQLPIRVADADAMRDGKQRGRPSADNPNVWELSVTELSDDERRRFTGGYEKLYRDAENYYKRRPDPSEATRNSPMSGEHYSKYAVKSGLVSEVGTSSYSGSLNQVESAVAEYQASGATVVWNGDRSIAVVTVTDGDPKRALPRFSTTLKVRQDI